MSKYKQQAEFNWVGQLVDFIVKDGYKIKYLRLHVSPHEYWVKLPKPLRYQLDPQIQPGCWLEVSGQAERCVKTGKLKLRAHEVALASEPAPGSQPASVEPETATADREPAARAKPSKAKVLVCQKSGCRKRGGDLIRAEIAANLEACGLAGQVDVIGTGCLKECKRGPNVVMMPDKARYSNVSPNEIPQLVAKHFAANACS